MNMNYLTYFTSPILDNTLPAVFPTPFTNMPHPIAKLACEQLQEFLVSQSEWKHDFDSRDGGKMFGVLVVKDSNDNIGFLSAFSGMLAGQWQLSGFVPPIFNEVERGGFLPEGESEVAALSVNIQALSESDEYSELEQTLLSLQRRHQDEYRKLKADHKSNKTLRQQKRVDIEKLFEIDESVASMEKQLIKLSFESQQDKNERKVFNKYWNEQIADARKKVGNYEAKIEKIKKERADKSRKLHRKVFSTYNLSNKLGEQEKISQFFEDNRPPGGAGDCAAPKLLHFANQHSLTPIALAEFWWGAPPSEGVRHHKHFYPACRGKCRPILPFMLKGLSVQAPPKHGFAFKDDDAPYTVYEDKNLVVVNKPEGLLSVPGKEVKDSVQTRMQKRYPEATGPLLVHRLDMATSGLLLVAKNLETHKALQSQFIKRIVEKRYVAILSSGISLGTSGDQGVIELPLRVDLEDRPRQVVCYEHGKKAKTHWEIISQEEGKTRVYFYPHTGRTHQLRVHASHIDGLNAPILGDKLYGENAERLFLHAECLRFINPVTGEKMEVVVPAPF